MRDTSKFMFYKKARRRHAISAYESPATAYVRGCVRRWLAHLAAEGYMLNKDFFKCFNWMTGDEDSASRLVLNIAEHNLPERYADIAARLEETADSIHASIEHCIARILWQTPSLEKAVRKKILADDASRVSISCRGTPFALARRRLRALFGLSDSAVFLAEFIFINQLFGPVEGYFEDHCKIWDYINRHWLACILGVSEEEASRSFAALEAARLIYTNDSDAIRLHTSITKLWSKEGMQHSLFCLPLRGSGMPLENFRLRPEEVAHVLALLRGATGKAVHILLYGQSGAGKTSFARSLAAACGNKAWAVTSRMEDDDDQRRASLSACLCMNVRHPGSLVLVDEAERLLDTDIRPGFANKDKAWLNDLLETPGSRVIWITNQVEHLDPAVLRRFSFSVHFDSLGLPERAALWRQIATDQRVEAYLPEQALQRLARDHDAPAAVISEAIRQAKTLYRKKAAFVPAIERVLNSQKTLRNHGMPPQSAMRAAPHFTLEGVSLEEAEGSVADLLAACRRINVLLRSPAGITSGTATMLFYGPPGTGKTALARYIAQEIDRECLVKRASDLLDPYVGMTERRIAQAFAAAETQGAVLIIDEADSFLSSRAELGRPWERTMVNEFLTALEDSRGICICTTNSRERMDAAAMRRFAHKLAFGYAKREQAAVLYNALLAPLVGSPLPPEEESALFRLTKLTPGDFQVVRTRHQSLFTTRDRVTHGELIAALRREMNLKLERNNRTIGFAMV